MREFQSELSSLKGERMLWEPLWDDIARYTVPNQYLFQREIATPGEDRTGPIYDGTAPNALTKFVSLLQSLGTNATTKWFQLALPPGIKPDEESQAWLDRNTREMLAFMDRDGFYKACDSFYESIGLFGNASMLVEENEDSKGGFNGYRFNTYPLNEIWFKTNKNQVVRTHYRRIKLTAAELLGEFQDVTFPREIYEGAASGDPKKYPVYHCVKPKDMTEPDGECVSVWYMEAPDLLLRVGEYKEFPFVVTRYRVSCNENYGRGPAGEVIGPIRLLNHLQRRGAQAADMSILGTILLQEGVELDEQNLRPGRVATIGDLNGYKEMVRTVQPQLFEAVRANNVQQVRAAFFQDQIELDMQRPEYSKAETVMETTNRNRLVLASLFNSLHGEFYIPLINRCFQLKYRAEKAAGVEAPRQIQQHGMNIQMQSVIAKSQMQVNLQAKRVFAQDLAFKMGIRPDVGDLINWDNWTKTDAEEAGVELSTLFLPMDQVNQIRQARQDMQMRQMQMQAIEQGASANLDLAKANSLKGQV